MAETSGFFDAEELVDGGYDREYVAEQWANYFKLFINNGVFITPTNQLKVQATSGMVVQVLSGWAWINGYWYNNSSNLSITIPANISSGTVKHGIFVRFDSSNRQISIVLGNGRTEVNRTAPYYELKLAEITVASGTTAIDQSMITDTRANNSVCGFVTGVVDVITTEDLFDQFTSIFNTWLAGVQQTQATKSAEFDTWIQTKQGEFNAWEVATKAGFEIWEEQTQSGFEEWEQNNKEGFENWFEQIKGQLGSDAAGNLQNQINIIDEAIANIEYTSSASRAYAVGECILYNRAFYKVITPVAQDDTWEDDPSIGNIEAMPKLTEVLRLAGDMHRAVYDPDEDGIIGIAQGGTGNEDGYIRTGAKLNSTIGVKATAEGYSTQSSGNSSHSEGYETIASKASSHAEGTHTQSSGNGSHSEGYAEADGLHLGSNTNVPGFDYTAQTSIAAIGEGSHAEGHCPEGNELQGAIQAKGSGSHAEGYATDDDGSFAAVILASGIGSHAEGYALETNIISSGVGSHAEGYGTQSTGTASHSEGYETIASGDDAHAEGRDTTASGSNSHAEGYSTIASGESSHVEGHSYYSNFIRASGKGSHAEGAAGKRNNQRYYIEASGEGAHAEGYSYTGKVSASAEGAHAEGCADTGGSIIASGKGAHAEGYTSTGDTVASGRGAHAEGTRTEAAGDFSHAEGTLTHALKAYSHAEGYGSKANAFYSHAGGNYGETAFNSEFALGGGFAQQQFSLVPYSVATFSVSDEVNCGYHGYSGRVEETATLTLELTAHAAYLLICTSYTTSSGAVYGATTRMITTPDNWTSAPTNVSLGQTSNAPATISMVAGNKITIKNSAATRHTCFTLIKIM